MKPIEFPQQNVVFAKDQKEYLPLPAYRSANGHMVTSCWRMSVWERLRNLFSGRVYVTLLTFGGALQPQIIGITPPAVE
jgi:hypothetical protein